MDNEGSNEGIANAIANPMDHDSDNYPSHQTQNTRCVSSDDTNANR